MAQFKVTQKTWHRPIIRDNIEVSFGVDWKVIIYVVLTLSTAPEQENVCVILC